MSQGSPTPQTPTPTQASEKRKRALTSPEAAGTPKVIRETEEVDVKANCKVSVLTVMMCPQIADEV
jgi:hypothetical protein